MSELQENKTRLFLAIEVPDTVQAQLMGLQEMRPDIRWMNPQQYHITLYFLGDCNTDEANRFVEITKECIEGLSEIPLKLYSVSVTRGKMIWACVADNTGQLTDLHEKIKDRAFAENIGQLKQPHKYTPHILLGKSKNNTILAEADPSFQHIKNRFHSTELTAKSVILFQSERLPEGTKHIQIKEFLFGQAEPEPDLISQSNDPREW